MKKVSRETHPPQVLPLMFRKYLREAIACGRKTVTRRLLTEQNTHVQPGTFAGVHWETGRVRTQNLFRAELRAQCKFDSGRVRVVSIYPAVQPGDVFYAKAGRYGSRKASDVTIEVRRVRITRLQDMTEAEAIAEGVAFVPQKLRRDTARDTFCELWNDLGGSWAANPWVWAYEFQGYNLNVDRYLADVRGL